ncbi:amidohydrolase family protein [Thermogymnomonas acidicola]|uniref:metal-dependent hydrolase family protein n=1 Tax=Thermogymnomonas acidicola TaxID=399579 RepID=UPI0014941A85|nr:amidohydrolase family protein [Thermogymnomonas acidicola]
MLERAEVSVNEASGEIEYVDETRQGTNQVNGKAIDRDITVLPGLIDTHIHFFGTASHDLADWVLEPVEVLVVNSVNDARHLIRAGFTTVRTLGDKVSLGLSRAEKVGSLYGPPRIVSAGFSIAETGGGDDDPKFLPYEVAKALSYSYYCDGPWECRKAVRLNIRNGGAEAIKAYASRSFVGGGQIKPELTVEELSAIAEEAHRAHLKAAAHAYGEEAIRNTVDAGFDSVEHGLGLTEDLAEEIRKRGGMFYTPTLSAYMRERRDRVPYRDEMIERHISREMEIATGGVGLRIACGTDYVGTRTEPHGMNYREVLYLQRYLGPVGALRAATSTAADCIGRPDLGRLARGKRGDIVVVSGDPPTKDASNLEPDRILFVAKSGKTMLERGA